MNREFLELIKTRRSFRKSKPEQITTKITAVLEKAQLMRRLSRGMQSPYIVAVQNPALREQLAAMNARVMGTTSNPYYDAPTYVLVLTPADANNPIQDRRLRTRKHDAGCSFHQSPVAGFTVSVRCSQRLKEKLC